MPTRGTVLVIHDNAWIRVLVTDCCEMRVRGRARCGQNADLDVLHRVKQRASTRDVPAIILSAYPSLLMRAHPRFRLLLPASEESEPLVTRRWSSPELRLPFRPIAPIRPGAVHYPHTGSSEMQQIKHVPDRSTDTNALANIDRHISRSWSRAREHH
jgi:hypothetical protein